MRAPMPVAVVDIDGVVADVRHRLRFLERRPKDWNGFFSAADRDTAHDEGVALVQLLARDHEIVFLTGRPERLRRVTQAWLDRHGMGGHRLVMRSGSDRRPAAVTKVEALKGLAEGRTVGLVVDDDPMVVAALRDAGYATLHADWERRGSEPAVALLEGQEVDGRT